MSNKEDNLKIKGNDVCAAMHAALRKCCDSSATSAAYNLIHLLDIRPKRFCPWRMLGRLVAEQLNNKQALGMAFTLALAQLDNEFYDELQQAKTEGITPPDDCQHAMLALRCIMLSFDEDDIAGVVAFLA